MHFLNSALQVLTDTDHCYCVLLNANGGAAFPSEKAQEDCSSSDSSSLKSKTDTRKSNKTKVYYVNLWNFNHYSNTIGLSVYTEYKELLSSL